MTKVAKESQVAIDAANGVLEKADVRHSRDINAPAIAAICGARIVYAANATSRANIVRAGRRAIICVDEKARGTTSEALTVAHELGHHTMHAVTDHYEQCEPDAKKRSGTDWKVEREAYDFGRALLAPAFLATPYCNAPRPSFDDLERFARTFPLSFEASVIRYVQLANGLGIPCAAAMTRADGTIKWAPETRAFPGSIKKDRRLHPSSFASRVFNAKKDRGGAEREVPGEAWGGSAPFLEQSIYLGASGGVLSWIVPA